MHTVITDILQLQQLSDFGTIAVHMHRSIPSSSAGRAAVGCGPNCSIFQVRKPGSSSQCVSAALQIVAGLEPEHTNAFLQMLGRAARMGPAVDAVQVRLAGQEARPTKARMPCPSTAPS